MTSKSLFDQIFVPHAVLEATSDHAWLQAMLDFEPGLAVAEARDGLVPEEAARAIAAACRVDQFDVQETGCRARAAGNPVKALVGALTHAVPPAAAGYAHRGATSQDVLDTAAMLVARRTLELIDAQLASALAACARLAHAHRATPMVGRTLLQQALPITFGLKAAGWLVGVGETREQLAAIALPVELGGAAGTLASLGQHGTLVLGLLTEELELAEPVLPWHTTRTPVAQLGTALALAAGALEKVAVDVVLLARTEIGEVAEPAGGGCGGSSTLPPKRNPVGSVVAIACARGVRGAAEVLLGTMAQEHERAAGAWHAEWRALREALELTGGAAATMRDVLDGLEVHPDRMRENLEATQGLVLSDDAEVTAHLSPGEIERVLDPSRYLGSADAFVARVLERYRSREDAGEAA